MIIKITYLLSAVALIVVCSHAGNQFAFQPPQGHTGATGDYCTNCHSDFALNSGGGNVTVAGLPDGSYTPGTAYNFSLTISHGAANRNRWGFSIAARNAAGSSIGTFSSTHPNAGPNGNELSHNNGAVSQGPQASYTYNNLRWTAPTNPGASDNQVTFYYVGNAANGNGNNGGDYIYAGSTVVALPIALSAFNATVNGTTVYLKWSTTSESNSSHFIIEKSADNQHFAPVATVKAAGNSNSIKTYEYTDDKPAYYERATFYRLALIDKDGSKKYSNVVSVMIKARNSFVKKLYPNPVRIGAIMQVEVVADRAQEVTLNLLSTNGRRVKQQQAKLVKGNNIIEVPVHKYNAAGMYVLVVQMEEVTQQIPLLIQH